MNVFDWVDDAAKKARELGKTRLADLYDQVPADCNELRHDRLDLGVSEALGLAEGDPWTEIYFRHWHLQSRVFHRCEGERALADCVSLVEFSHREGHRACPQSVCSVQDLAACYGRVDGPGYAEERLAVTQETLNRIDATWNCWTCIAGEHADALADAGRYEETLRWIEDRLDDMRRAGETPDTWSLGSGARIDALLALGRGEEALRFLDRADREGRRDESSVLTRRLTRAQVCARLGQLERAREVLPDRSQLSPTPELYCMALEVWRELLRGGAIALDAEQQAAAAGMARRLGESGAWHLASEAWQMVCQIAILRGRRGVAGLALAELRRVSARLRRPGDWPGAIGALQRQIDGLAAPEHARSGTAEEALEEPDLPLHQRVEALRICGFPEQAREAIDEQVAAHPEDPAGWSMLARLGRSQRDPALLQRAAAGFRAMQVPLTALYLEAEAARAAGDLERCLAICAEVVAADAGSPNTLALWAEVAASLGRWDEAATRALALEALRPDDKGITWDLLVYATLARRWDEVRAAWTRLTGRALPGEGPVQADGPAVRIRAGGDLSYRAVRDGPVTATIRSTHTDPALDRYGERVVFRANPENPEADGEDVLFVYPEVAVLEPRTWRRVVLDGVHPGKKGFNAFADALYAAGVSVFDCSNPKYKLKSPEGKKVQGLYVILEVPPALGDEALHRALSEAAGEQPIVWPALARAAGDADALGRQEALCAAWGISAGE